MSGSLRKGRTWLILGVLTLVAACSHEPLKVDCNGHLVPINPVTSPGHAGSQAASGAEKP